MKCKVCIVSLLLLIGIVGISCEERLEVKRNYAFEVKTEKYHEQIEQGETTTLRSCLEREGKYEGAEYYVSYFLRQGSGTLSDEDWNVLEENTYYKISPDNFVIRYTSASPGNHKIELQIKDSFGNVKETVISFTGK